MVLELRSRGLNLQGSGCEASAHVKGEPDIVFVSGISRRLRLRRMRPLARYAVGHVMLLILSYKGYGLGV